jgi:hypothetical protein
MLVNTVLSVVVGLVFTWLVLSVAVMYIQEWLSARLRWRSTMLEITIRNMLSDPALTDQLYNHPLIRCLYTGENGSRKPSYIPSSQFALALCDIVMTAGSEASLIQQQLYRLRWDINRLKGKQKKNAQRRLSMILAMTRRTLVSDAGEAAENESLEAINTEIKKLAEDFPKLKTAVQLVLENVQTQKAQIASVLNTLQARYGSQNQEVRLGRLRTGVAALSITHPRLKQTLSALFGGVNDISAQYDATLPLIRQSIEVWFNNSMERLTGWYKRRSQVLGFVIGISLAVVANVDSVVLANNLWREPVLRNSLEAQAQSYVNNVGTGLESPTAEQTLVLQSQLAGLDLPVGWIGSPIPIITGGYLSAVNNVKLVCKMVPSDSNEFWGLPFAGQCYPIINLPGLRDFQGWILKIIGLVITGLAAAQGAPFWFDVLKKFINVRTSGINPSEAQSAVG